MADCLDTFALAETAMQDKGAADAAALAAKAVSGQLNDAELLAGRSMIPTWRPRDFSQVPVGTPYQWEGMVYKLLQPHNAAGNEGWTPDAVPALWSAVSLPGETGTADDPITAARGMEYTYGRYYRDPEDGKTYLCTRTGEEPGGTVILQYLPHELAGQYFTETGT